MSSFFTASRARILILACLILVRFGYQIIGQIAFVVSTYILSYLFFRTIPKTDRHLYNLGLPNKKMFLIAGAVALLGMAINIAVTWLFMGGVWTEQLTSIGNPIIFATGFPIYLASALIVQFILNALPEEFLFRGFLWGSMRQYKCSDFSILCAQTILFWVGHYYYYDMPACRCRAGR
jgi:membrane protease YdiL (CAAX protease family)